MANALEIVGAVAVVLFAAVGLGAVFCWLDMRSMEQATKRGKSEEVRTDGLW